MERTMTAYTTINEANTESNEKERLTKMITRIKTKTTSFLSRLRKKEITGHYLNNFDAELQIEKARANMSSYTQFKALG